MFTCVKILSDNSTHLGNTSFPGNERRLVSGTSSLLVDPILSATNDIYRPNPTFSNYFVIL